MLVHWSWFLAGCLSRGGQILRMSVYLLPIVPTVTVTDSKAFVGVGKIVVRLRVVSV